MARGEIWGDHAIAMIFTFFAEVAGGCKYLWRQSPCTLIDCTKPVLYGLAWRKKLKRDEILTMDLDLLWTVVERLYDSNFVNGLGSTLKERDTIRPKYLLQVGALGCWWAQVQISYNIAAVGIRVLYCRKGWDRWHAGLWSSRWAWKQERMSSLSVNGRIDYIQRAA